MKHKKTETFVFRKEYLDFLDSLGPDEDFVFCFKAICDFAFDCKPLPKFNDRRYEAELNKICSRIDEDLCEYQARCEAYGS